MQLMDITKSKLLNVFDIIKRFYIQQFMKDGKPKYFKLAFAGLIGNFYEIQQFKTIYSLECSLCYFQTKRMVT